MKFYNGSCASTGVCRGGSSRNFSKGAVWNGPGDRSSPKA